MSLIPVTILTGFLGAGKTTLLNRLLREPHGYKIAVIENEFGAEGIDTEILMQDDAQQIIEMNNGCICCTVRGDLVAALTTLGNRRTAGEITFDHVVIESTGLANPGPVAQTFFLDDAVRQHYLLDAVITVVDARHGMQQLDRHEEAQRQVGFADRLLMSKADLVAASAVQALTVRLQRINPRAPVIRSDFGTVAIAQVLDIRGFHLDARLEHEACFLAADDAHNHAHLSGDSCAADCAHPDHDRHIAAGPPAGGISGQHKDDITSFVFRSDRAFDGARLQNFLAQLVGAFGADMLRYKGILWIDGAERKIVFQGMHELMGSDGGAAWTETEKRGNKIVFIGKNLPQATFIGGLEQCLV